MDERKKWFPNDRFGMFIHWGIYAMPARGEWVRHWERIDVPEYEKYAAHFDPDLYDANEWARAAKQAGMKYAVLTAKHHDGFCLWDSHVSEYTVMNSPGGTDLIREYVDAFRAAGLKVGLYYSLLDWHHPDFPIDGIHPLRGVDDVEARNSTRKIERYRQYLHAQVRELLTEYGQIDYLFFDFTYEGVELEEVETWGGKGKEDWGSEALLGMIHQLQPGIIVNDRLGIPGDVVTPEQYQPSQSMGGDDVVGWEMCMTMNDNWGYSEKDKNFKPADQIIRSLVDAVSKGGNLLLNVGPTARGQFDARSVERLTAIGDWMTLHSRSIYGASESPFSPPADVRYTQRGDRLYAHIFSWPLGHIHLPELAGKVEYAQMLNDGSEVKFRELAADKSAILTEMGGVGEGTLTLQLPGERPNVLVPVVEIFLRQGV